MIRTTYAKIGKEFCQRMPPNGAQKLKQLLNFNNNRKKSIQMQKINYFWRTKLNLQTNKKNLHYNRAKNTIKNSTKNVRDLSAKKN